MKLQRRPRTYWLGRVLRGRRLDRNPLRRRSDRIETAVLGLLLAAFLAGAPFAAHAAGSWAYATSARGAQAQRASLHQVPATLLKTAPAWNAYANGEGPPKSTPGGGLRTGRYEPVKYSSRPGRPRAARYWCGQTGLAS